MAQEQGIGLQSDTLSPVAGGPIRTMLVTTLINGVPTQVQMQVVAIADERGVPFEPPLQAGTYDKNIYSCLRDIRSLLSFFTGVAIVERGEPFEDPSLNL